jgi:serine/threonine protein phosphatase PrpC
MYDSNTIIQDVMRNEEVAEVVLLKALSEKDFINAGKAVCQEAIIMGSTDNVTTLVVDLK